MISSLEFRVWHTPTKILHLVSSYNLVQGEVWVQPKEGASEFERDYLCDNPFSLDECIMMQFTDLLDERGQKVWEGDVFRLDIMWIGKVPKGEEEYSEYSYVGVHKGGFANFPLSYDNTPEDIEGLIRSNIFYLANYGDGEGDKLPFQRVACMHEHPELLKLTQFYPLHPDAIRKHAHNGKVPA